MSETESAIPLVLNWKNGQKIAFRFFFIFFIIQAVPLDWKFYGTLFSINWLHPDLFSVLNLTRYSPQFLSEHALAKWGIESFGNWGVALILAALGATIWGFADRESKNYNLLYYYLRVILRYRLAIGIIAYGLIKLFPLQIPPPTLSELNTNYGDFYAWKIYYLTTGMAVNHYESSLGLIEILGGLLLLCRRTATIGAGLVATFVINVVMANFAYHVGDHVYATYLLVIALFLLAYDVPRLYDLFISSKPAIANKFNPVFSKNWQSSGRLVFKYGFLLFVFFIGVITFQTYNTAPYVHPQNPGLAKSYGYYNVKEFKLNNQLIPYSVENPDRWQNVVFEKWNTLSIKINRPVLIDATLPGQDRFDGNYEQAGNGGRDYFSYQADTLKQLISLTNKTQSGQKLSLHYKRLDDSTIVVSGITEKRDSVYAVLEKVNRKYLLAEGRRKPVRL